jgi:HSP20 family molecular chaperone IbpA
LKAVSERRDAHRYELELEAPGGSEVRLGVRINRNGVRVSGAELAGATMRVRFPAGDGYQRTSVVFTW